MISTQNYIVQLEEKYKYKTRKIQSSKSTFICYDQCSGTIRSVLQVPRSDSGEQGDDDRCALAHRVGESRAGEVRPVRTHAERWRLAGEP